MNLFEGQKVFNDESRKKASHAPSTQVRELTDNDDVILRIGIWEVAHAVKLASGESQAQLNIASTGRQWQHVFNRRNSRRSPDKVVNLLNEAVTTDVRRHIQHDAQGKDNA